MSFSLLLSKSILVPTGGAVAVGASAGGAYYVYSTKYSSNSSTNNEAKPIKSNSFLARVKGNVTGTISATSTFTCEVETAKEVDCQVFKFNDAQTNNGVTNFDKTKISAIANNGDLVDKNYVLVEVNGKALTFTQLKNKTITLKSGSSITVSLEFDQLLVKTTDQAKKETYSPIAPVIDTYIVSTATPITSSDPADATISSFRCKYSKTSATNQIVNIDDLCKLITIPEPTSSKTITSLEQVKTATTIAADLTESTFYKLIVNRNQLYNLDLVATKTDLTVELTAASKNKSSTLTIHQQLTDDGFVGKTNLILGKVKVTKTTANGTVTGSQCSFSNTTPPTNQFACQIHKATEASSGNDLHNLTLTEGVVDASEAFEVNKYFVIKLTAAQDISTLTQGKKIYYQITKTASSGSTTQYETVELEIAQLLSGEFSSSKKPLYITNHASQEAA